METKRRQWLENFYNELRTTHGLKLDMVEEWHDIANRGLEFLELGVEEERRETKDKEHKLMWESLKALGFKVAELDRELHEPTCMSADDPEPTYDIAKNRWKICSGGIYHNSGYLIGNISGFIEEDANLMAAAPELADLMRDEINDMNRSVNDRKERLLKRIKLLRRLGIPHVALWYKGA